MSMATSLFGLGLFLLVYLWPSAVRSQWSKFARTNNLMVIFLGLTMVGFQILLHVLGTLATIQLRPGIQINVGSSLLYPLTLAALLFTYVARRPGVFRFVWLLIFAVNLAIVSLTCMLRNHWINADQFSEWTPLWESRATYSITLGTLMMLFEVVIMIFAYAWLVKHTQTVFFRFLVPLLVVLLLDALLYSYVVAHFTHENFGPVLLVQLFTKAISAVVYAGSLTWYIAMRDANKTELSELTRQPIVPVRFCGQLLFLVPRLHVPTLQSGRLGLSTPVGGDIEMLSSKTRELSKTSKERRQNGAEKRRAQGSPGVMSANLLSKRLSEFRDILSRDKQEARKRGLSDLANRAEDPRWLCRLVRLIEDLDFPDDPQRAALAKSLFDFICREYDDPRSRRESSESIASAFRKFGLVATSAEAKWLSLFLRHDDLEASQMAAMAIGTIFCRAPLEVKQIEPIRGALRWCLARLQETQNEHTPEFVGVLSCLLQAAVVLGDPDLPRWLTDYLADAENWEKEFLSGGLERLRDSDAFPSDATRRLVLQSCLDILNEKNPQLLLH